ncbi:MAG: hypothetical protein FJ405_16220 [Verrucomicrobia bacterium]|nr:hypothetical protein [Verrucomicrobiota bacterium]
MRQGRFKTAGNGYHACYHLISRVVDKAFVFGEREKKQFCSLLHEYAQFCGIEILTFSLLSNHFHLLVKVPSPPQTPISDDELIAKLNSLTTGKTSTAIFADNLRCLRAQGRDEDAQALRDSVLYRLYDISEFMKSLKQRYTQWHNRLHDRQGTLWEGRFTSIIVDDSPQTLATVAAYIDLNAVRANLVEDPKDYPWCSFHLATTGDTKARLGIQWMVTGGKEMEPEQQDQAIAKYRMHLYGKGGRGEGRRIDRKKVLEVIDAGGEVSELDYLMVRVGYMSRGVFVGVKRFVEERFAEFRYAFSKKRKTGARRMRGLEGGWLYSARELKRKALS